MKKVIVGQLGYTLLGLAVSWYLISRLSEMAIDFTITGLEVLRFTLYSVFSIVFLHIGIAGVISILNLLGWRR